MSSITKEWTRFTISRGSDSQDGRWWIGAPYTRRSYALRGVTLYEWDQQNSTFVERGNFMTYQEARQFVKQQ